ncbi:MAG TPA: chromate transporter [Firmicutes bacterium]|nr:chromate transporter [Candidatus Fermentithermobacillaceae bacterium]
MLLRLFLTFAKIGAFSFGGGYAMIPLISHEVVTANGWITMDEFIDVVALSQATPGPIAINSATYIGYKVAGFWGSLAATAGVVTPSFAIMLILGFLFYKYRDVAFVKDIFRGIRPVVVVLIVSAALSVVPSTLTGVIPGIVAAVSAALILGFKKDPVLVLLAAGALGLILYL